MGATESSLVNGRRRVLRPRINDVPPEALFLHKKSQRSSTSDSIDRTTILTADTGRRHSLWGFDLGASTPSLSQPHPRSIGFPDGDLASAEELDTEAIRDQPSSIFPGEPLHHSTDDAPPSPPRTSTRTPTRKVLPYSPQPTPLGLWAIPQLGVPPSAALRSAKSSRGTLYIAICSSSACEKSLLVNAVLGKPTNAPINAHIVFYPSDRQPQITWCDVPTFSDASVPPPVNNFFAVVIVCDGAGCLTERDRWVLRECERWLVPSFVVRRIVRGESGGPCREIEDWDKVLEERLRWRGDKVLETFLKEVASRKIQRGYALDFDHLGEMVRKGEAGMMGWGIWGRTGEMEFWKAVVVAAWLHGELVELLDRSSSYRAELARASIVNGSPFP